MLCASTLQENQSLSRLQGQFPDYDRATFIPDPSAFAMQLGKDIGKQFNMDTLRLNDFERIRKIVTQEHGIDAAVVVSHGPVVYSDSREKIINRFPLGDRGSVMQFVKHSRFADQREYRFVINLNGEPTETEFLMKITDDLRGLTYPGSR